MRIFDREEMSRIENRARKQGGDSSRRGCRPDLDRHQLFRNTKPIFNGARYRPGLPRCASRYVVHRVGDVGRGYSHLTKKQWIFWR